ncbi:hypothetical protein SCYAM73S_04841 [Streptomyces cyaneofuscatus]
MQPSAPPFDERLTAPRSWWFIAFGIGVACALMLLPLGALPMLAGLVGGTARRRGVAVTAPRIRVVAGALVAGDPDVYRLSERRAITESG